MEKFEQSNLTENNPEKSAENLLTKEKEKQLVEQIAEYQRDRNNNEARQKAMEGIKERTLILSKKDYENYIDEKYNYLTEQERNLRKLMLGFSHTPETRAVLNKDALSESTLPYIMTHEETEILEEGPFPDEARKWEKEHNGEPHPQENINSHVEATYAEYRHAKLDGKLDEHHKYIVDEVRQLSKFSDLIEMIKTEEEQRNRIYIEVKNAERNIVENPLSKLFENNPEIAKIYKERIARDITINESGKILRDGQEYEDNPRMRSLVELADAIRGTIPNVQEGYVRLWRGNRKDEVGHNPSYTNSLEGIALPFLRSYSGVLSYIDVLKEDLEKYVMNTGSAKDSEFILPTDLVKDVKIVGLTAEQEEDVKKKAKPLPETEQEAQGGGWNKV